MIVLLKSIVVTLLYQSMMSMMVVSGVVVTFLCFLLVSHEAAHEVETEAENGENGPENGDHLPSVGVSLRQEGRVDGLRVVAFREKVFKVLEAVVKGVLAC